ncbi:MAG: hypothetical protein O9289_01975 [Rhodobacteraceae bacterium]|jgi:hypothetical protein|nr:hypothetical protein [Paracoccaceae bacterium]MCZ8081940.1 hypothetical protein [Paracoccaceae bacterium]
MLVKIFILFLGGMALIGLIGKWLFPGAIRRAVSKRASLAKPSRCGRCGRYLIGTDGCDCGKKG